MSTPFKKQIVLIEDNGDFADTLKEFIEDATPYQIVHFKAGSQALAYLEDRSNSVIGILSDLMMKDMDGIDFLARLRKNHVFGSKPLIFISGTEPMVFESLLRPYKYSAFVQKPVDFMKIISLIEQHFVQPAAQKAA